MYYFKIILLYLTLTLIASCSPPLPPESIGPLPSSSQKAWHELEYYGFVHFNMNTFSNMEWGTGGEPPELFNPSQLDTRQWARVAKAAGMKGIIITAKHHDGFCLWPTAYSEHSIKNSPYQNGNGDILKELSEACKEYGLKMGVYLSPWDRNHAEYGTPEYVTYFHNQLRELLSNYGEIFEVWFDGANGGTGYYGGANESRKIDNKTYYQWDKAEAIVRELQPNAIIFSDSGPGTRWVGNEEGWANKTNWSIMRRDEMYPGWPRYIESRSGHEDGTHWLPAEADVSIRPGWYYHPAEDHQVKTLPHLLDIYYHSVGRNANLLLNLPVDIRGLVHEKDAKQLIKLREQLDKDFKIDLAINKNVKASNTRAGNSNYSPKNLVDGNTKTYWATDDDISEASVTINLNQLQPFNRILIQENISLGQRVKQFSVEVEVAGNWKTIAEETTIGYKRILRLETVETAKVRINYLESKGPLAISNIELFHAPKVLSDPVLSRDKDGMVSMSTHDLVDLYYTLDESAPSTQSIQYREPFVVSSPTLIRAITYDSGADKYSVESRTYFDVNKKSWNVINVSSGDLDEAQKAIDDNRRTFWSTEKGSKGVQEVTIDLNTTYTLYGITYQPMQERFPFGVIREYELLISKDNKKWKSVAQGEFGNIVNSPIQQIVPIEPIDARYIKMKSLRASGEDNRSTFAEIGIITSNQYGS